MAEKRLKRPRDPLSLAKMVGDIATGHLKDGSDDGKDPSAIALGRKGGVARRDKLTPDRRKSIASKAAAKRWKK